MEYAYSVWQIGAIALVAGVLIGALAYRLFAPSVKQADQVKSELDQAKEEMESYRQSVNSHFNKTSELVNNLTQDYVKVYQHLADGAQTLGDSKTFNNLLEQPGRVVISVDETPKRAEPVIDPAPPVESSTERPDEHAAPFVAAAADAKQTAKSPASEAGAETTQGQPASVASAAAAQSGAVDTESPVDEKQRVKKARLDGDREQASEPGEPVIDLGKIEAEVESSEASKVASVAAGDTEKKVESPPLTH